MLHDQNEYLLVVDEVHKLYSAGGYRDEAINPILRAIQNKTAYKSKLLVTATYTDLMGKLAKLEPDTRIRVAPAAPIQRSLEVRAYQKSSPLNWLKHVQICLEARASGKGIVFVRLNSTARIDKCSRFLTQLGYTTMTISRATSNQEAVRMALQKEKLPEGIDVVFATSILDEAVDLKNAAGEIVSVHVVDGTAHPEEIVQFMGRLRSSNPPVYLHLNPPEGFLQEKEPVQTKGKLTRAESVHGYLTQMAELSMALVKEMRRSNKNLNVHEFVSELNTTISRFTDGDMLQLTGDEEKPVVRVNQAGILASSYHIDKSAAYVTFADLTQRLQTLLPSLTVTLVEVPAQDLKTIQTLMGGIEEKLDELAKTATKEAGQKMMEVYEATECNSLKTYAEQSLEQMDDPILSPIPYAKRVDPMHFDSYVKGLRLATILVEPADVEDALLKGRYHEIMVFDRSFDDHLANCIRDVVSGLFEPEEALEGEIDAEDAVAIVVKAAEQAVKKYPVLKDVIKDGRNYAKVLSLDAKGKIQAKPGKAMNLLASLLNCDDKNSHKPAERYLILKGLNWKGYRYHRLAPLDRSEFRSSPSLAAMFEDEDDVVKQVA